jgi:hypothetical protein
MSTQKRSPWAFLVAGAIAAGGALAGDPASGVAPAGAGTLAAAPPMNALSVEPRVPRLGIAPCVVELFRDLAVDNGSEEGPFDAFEYVPPAGCPGPWAKVILSVDLRSPNTAPPYYAALDNIMFSLGDQSRDPNRAIELMVATPQINEGSPSWRVERDVTDYSALLYAARTGFATNTDRFFRFPCDPCVSAIATGRLIFYPATAIQPAPDVPDAVYRVASFPAGGLPRNVERAYVDMYPQLWNAWFSCVPASAFADYPILIYTPVAIGDVYDFYENNPHGCQAPTYYDVVVAIDGQPAGAGTPYPWLNSNLNLRFPRSVDVPVPTTQSINLMPVRVDITPFAALLSNGAAHVIGTFYQRPDGFRSQGPSSAMLVFLDHGSQQVTGAVTTNTLASGVPWIAVEAESTEVRNQWRQENDVLHGDVENHYLRKYEIAGYVNTSRGRIDSRVRHEHVLTNAQLIRVDDMSNFQRHTYAQNLDLVSTTTRSSLRQQGAKVLALDKERYHYPLKIDYQATGGATGGNADSYVERARASVVQGHHQQRAFYRPEGSYANRLYANFAGNRSYDALTDTSSHWYGARSHYFNDSAGSCFRERVTWLRTTLTSHTQGEGCPDGYNRVRGFAHPDGSPESLGWLR